MTTRPTTGTATIRPLLSVGAASRALVFLTMAAGGVVFAEPAPVDVLMMGLIILLPIVGLVRFTPLLLLSLVPWLIAGMGALIAASLSADVGRSTVHTLVSLYLYAAFLMLAAFVAAEPTRHARIVLNGTLIGAVVAALAGLIGYFGLVGGAAELFTKYGRASGTFKDPNVFGPFLVPAILYCLHTVLVRPLRVGLPALVTALLLMLALLLSFSRGAWFNLAVSLVVFGYVFVLTTRSPGERLRVTLYGVLALLVLAGAIVAALQFEGVAKLMAERSTLTQGYDVGPEGRFGGQAKALGLILSHPFGIGATRFAALYHHEDVHNVYLSMLLNAGWLGGLAYLAAVVMGLLIGLRYAFVCTPSRAYLLIAFAALVGNVMEGFVIDTDHWRHFYTLLALVVGLAAGEEARRRAR